jgi:hypothetical protein
MNLHEDTEFVDTILDSSCAICLSTTENRPVRMIRACQHSFHAECLDEWLTRKAECPLCRGELPSLVQATRQRALLEQVQELIGLLQRDLNLTRSILTYLVVGDLLQRFPSSLGRGGLREAGEEIRAALEGIIVNEVRPFPIALESRYSLQRQQRTLRSTLAEQLGCHAANVHRHERVRRIREQVDLAHLLPPLL